MANKEKLYVIKITSRDYYSDPRGKTEVDLFPESYRKEDKAIDLIKNSLMTDKIDEYVDCYGFTELDRKVDRSGEMIVNLGSHKVKTYIDDDHRRYSVELTGSYVNFVITTYEIVEILIEVT